MATQQEAINKLSEFFKENKVEVSHTSVDLRTSRQLLEYRQNRKTSKVFLPTSSNISQQVSSLQ